MRQQYQNLKMQGHTGPRGGVRDIPNEIFARTSDAVVYILGVTPFKDNHVFPAENLTDPSFGAMYLIDISGFGAAYTDGDNYYRKHDNKLEPIAFPPHKRGLVKTAIKAYLDGVGNRVSTNGRRITVDNIVVLSYAVTNLFGINKSNE